MKKNRVAIAAMVFLGLLILTISALKLRDRKPSTSLTQAQFPETDRAQIDELEITRPGEQTVALQKRGDHWTLVAPLEAPADQSAVDDALKRLGNMDAVTVVATKAANHKRLEVDPPRGVHVVVKSDGNTLADLWLGKYASGNTMVRVEGGDEVFGVMGSFRYLFDKELRSWRKREITDVDDETVVEISLSTKKKTMRFVHDDKKKWLRAKGTKKIKDFDPEKVNTLVSTFSKLRATDFAPPNMTSAEAGLDAPTTTLSLVTKKQDAENDQQTPSESDEQIILNLSASGPNPNQFYVQRRGDDTIYVISRHLADKMRPDPKNFQTSAEEAAATAAPAPPPQLPNNSMPQLPPEILKQLQEKARQR